MGNVWSESHATTVKGRMKLDVYPYYIKNNYFVRDGVDIGAQQVHPHNHFLHIIQNLHTWDVRL